MAMATLSVDPFLVVGLSLLILVILVINVYILAYWQHPEDKNQSYFAKIIILFGLQLSSMSVLMIPIDVANNGGDPQCDLIHKPSSVYCGGVNMMFMWESLFSMICFVVIVLIPFETFFYESQIGNENNGTTKKCGACFTAVCYESVVAFGFLILLLALYFTSAGISVPVDTHTVDISNAVAYQFSNPNGSSPYDIIHSHLNIAEMNVLKEHTTITTLDITFKPSFPVYLIGLFGWIGWWLFAVFAGVGMIALPFDMILAFVWRPKILAPDEAAQREMELQDRTSDILDIAMMLKKDRQAFLAARPSRIEKHKRQVTDRVELNRLTQMVFLLERDIEELRNCKNVNKDYNPLIPIFKLVAGCFLFMISAIWIVQIVLYMINEPPISPFLNLYLIWFDSWFPMFGNLTYALLSLYLLFCTIAGCFKVGLRFLCIKIHPMEVGKTYVSSFLFNLAIILICTIPVVHFCALAFAGYARATDAFVIFDVQVRYMQFFSQFYAAKIFIWIILIASAVSVPYLAFRPREVAPSTEEFKQKLYSRGAGYTAVNGSSSTEKGSSKSSRKK